MPDRNVSTEAMSPQARPIEGVRLVEEGRKREKPTTDVPCPENPHVRRLAWRVARVEAAAKDKNGVLVVTGYKREDIGAMPDSEDVTFADLGYRGSHDLLDGHIAALADMCGLAQAMHRAIDDCWELYVAEGSGES